MKIISTTIFFLLLLLSTLVHAQGTFVNPIYAVQKTDSDLVYGSAIDYKGCTRTLRLDIYKPMGSTTVSRPLLVLVHGGSFVSGTKVDLGITGLAQEFAARGYVVASVEYRLGTHLRGYVPAPYNLGDATTQCVYADGFEIERAAFRGMQDVKGAIRFLKNRAALDSVNTDWVFVGGESAGAIVANLVGFLDDPSERPASCSAVADAPVPGSNLTCSLNICTNNSRLRPALGSVYGNLNLLPGIDATVAGVVSLYGAMFSNLFTINNTPPCRFYAYHQMCDPIISVDSGDVYRNLDACIYYCSGWTPFQMGVGPQLKGTTAMMGYVANSPWSGIAKSHIIPNGIPPAPCTCVIALSSTCHMVQNIPAEADSIARFLGPCLTVGVYNAIATVGFTVFPNPAQHEVFMEMPSARAGVKFELFNIQGKNVQVECEAIAVQKFRMELKNVLPGLYFIRYSTSDGVMGNKKLVVQ